MTRLRWNVWPFALAAILLASGCTTLHQGDADVDSQRKELGLASWYGAGFDRRVTANGERFAMAALTAAHRTLPFGTIVLVTNLENTRQVRVRINDRGPYAPGRILDLSYAAAQELHMVESGTSRISLQVMPAGDEAGAAPKVISKKSALSVISFHASLHQAKPERLRVSQSDLAVHNLREAPPHRATLGDVRQRRARRYAGFLKPDRPA